MIEKEYDVVVVGHGMAGLCAAISAKENGADVICLEKSPKEKCGGHTRYAFAVRSPMVELDSEKFPIPEDCEYDREEFYNDIMEVTDGRADEKLSRVLTSEMPKTMEFLDNHGVEWLPTLLDYIVPGLSDIPGPLVGILCPDGSGEKVIDVLTKSGEELGVDFVYNTEARKLLRDDKGEIKGLEAYSDQGYIRYYSQAVIICCGGFESNPQMRAEYIQDGDLLPVRGSRHNTGEAIQMGLDTGAKPEGNWSDAHVIMMDEASPSLEAGVTNVTGFNHGIVVNKNGKRFLDEGESIYSDTYAKFGKNVFRQPERVAYLIVDEELVDYIHSEGPTDPIEFNDLETLAEDMGIDKEGLKETVEKYNRAVKPGDFIPHLPDGKCTEDIEPPKSNWAVEIQSPPFYVIPMKPGITFTFGGLKIDTKGRVLDTREKVIPGLYAAGNSTGGLFWGNYPGGSGQARASTFGRIAGKNAAKYIK